MSIITEILIDFSGSMADRLHITKQALINDIIPSLDYSSRLGIKTFTSTNNQVDIQQILPLSITNKESIVEAVNKLGTPKGGTPMSAAIRESIKGLREFAANDKKIILITDGAEDAGGDYVAEAKKGIADGVNCQIHIIGIGISDKGQLQAQEISKLTNGTYSSIPFTKTTNYSSVAVKDSLFNFYGAVSRTTVPYNFNSLQISNLRQKPPR